MRIGFTGDFYLGGRLSLMTEGELKVAFSDLARLTKDNDCNIFDLEAPITEANDAIPKTGPNIKNPLVTACLLDNLNCSLCATANNHFYDFGLNGINDSYRELSKYSISWVGSGVNEAEAKRPHVFEKDGVSVGIINICENEWTTITDDDQKSGCYGLDVIDLTESIDNLQPTVDHVVVIYHGGHEHYNLPSPRVKKLLRYCIDRGASAVVGHHTHVISGFEVYKNAPIFYSLGNLCFDRDGHRNSSWNYGMILRLDFNKSESVRYQYDFINQNSLAPGVKNTTETEKASLHKDIQRLNSIIESDDLLYKAFLQYANSQKDLYSFWMQTLPSKFYRLVKLGILPSLLTPMKKRLLTNLIRCEAHKDVLLSALKQQ